MVPGMTLELNRKQPGRIGRSQKIGLGAGRFRLSREKEAAGVCGGRWELWKFEWRFGTFVPTMRPQRRWICGSAHPWTRCYLNRQPRAIASSAENT
jgi:hypothetical protein